MWIFEIIKLEFLKLILKFKILRINIKILEINIKKWIILKFVKLISYEKKEVE